MMNDEGLKKMAELRCFLCNKKLGWLDDKFGKADITKFNIPIPEGLSDKDVICYNCLQSEENKSYKPISPPKKDHPEFQVKYVGGHLLYPKSRNNAYIEILSDKLCITMIDFQGDKTTEITLDVPYKSIIIIENADEKKIAAMRVVLLGVIGALWKKKHIYTVIRFKDELENEQTMVFDFGDKIETIQPLIYSKVLEHGKRT